MLEPDHDHGPRLLLARSDLGSVTACACGVVTLTLHCLSVRFQPSALEELEHLLASANARLRPALQQVQHTDDANHTQHARNTPSAPLMSNPDDAEDGPRPNAVH